MSKVIFRNIEKKDLDQVFVLLNQLKQIDIDNIDKDKAWSIVTGLDEDLYNPEDKVLDYMRSSEYKAGYSKPEWSK